MSSQSGYSDSRRLIKFLIAWRIVYPNAEANAATWQLLMRDAEAVGLFRPATPIEPLTENSLQSYREILAELAAEHGGDPTYLQALQQLLTCAEAESQAQSQNPPRQ